ncbi:MAG TPA: TlpA disulfide reductase family protein [Terracidiphilus sp.]|nr:TlpA disulfide reductase family protein [Terracidiphilus sp.]
MFERRFQYLPGAVLLASLLLLEGCNRGAHPVQVGKRAPDFTVSDGANTIHLASYRGKVVLLNFWWSQCPPCIVETPALEQLHHDRPDLEIVGVSIDTDADSYHHFLTRYHVDIPTVMDPGQTAAKLYHTDGWPETYIIDRQGIIRRKVVGDPDWNNPEIRAFLKGM